MVKMSMPITLIEISDFCKSQIENNGDNAWVAWQPIKEEQWWRWCLKNNFWVVNVGC
jgi:hypothetical protein